MARVRILWDPKGFELDSLGRKRLLRITDGDTPYISLSIRMLSIDTPEVHYPGNQDPSRHDERFEELARWLHEGKAPVDDGLASHLYPRLATGRAGTLQKEQGKRATQEFQRLLDEKLEKPGGRRRPIFVRAADEPFDHYGRLLAYIAPSYTRQELDALAYKDRATFNLLMVESGWAAPFPIYPSLPKYRDLVLLQQVAEDAFENEKGAWSDPNTLAGYEFRMCYRLWEVTRKLVRGRRLSSQEKYGWVERYCVDMTTLEVYEPQRYYIVKPCNRIFIWPEDVTEAVGRLNLLPAT